MIVSELETSFSDEAVADFHELIEYLFSFGQQMIDQVGELAPFGAVIQPSGELKALGADPGSDGTVQEALELLEGGVTEGAFGEVRAVGICVDASRTDPESVTDIIYAHLEHVDGAASDVWLPYRRRRFRDVSYGEVDAEKSTRRILS